MNKPSIMMVPQSGIPHLAEATRLATEILRDISIPREHSLKEREN